MENRRMWNGASLFSKVVDDPIIIKEAQTQNQQVFGTIDHQYSSFGLHTGENVTTADDSSSVFSAYSGNSQEAAGTKKKQKNKNRKPVPLGPMFGTRSIDDYDADDNYSSSNLGDAPFTEKLNRTDATINRTQDRDEIDSNQIRWSETSSMVSSSSRTNDANKNPLLNQRSSFSSNDHQIRWSESSSPFPRIINDTNLDRPLPHCVGKPTHVNSNKKLIGRIPGLQYSDSESESDEINSYNNQSEGQTNNQLTRQQQTESFAMRDSNIIMENALNLPTPPSMTINNPNRSQLTRTTITNLNGHWGVTRPSSSSTLETTNSNFNNSSSSSSTILSDPYISQFVDRQSQNNPNTQNSNLADDRSMECRIIHSDHDNCEDEMGLRSINLAALQELRLSDSISTAQSSNSSNGTMTLTTANNQNQNGIQALPIPTIFTQTGTTTTLIKTRHDHLSTPLVLTNVRSALQNLAQKMNLHFEIRNDEGAIAFSQPSTHRILVLNSVLCVHNQNVEEIRVTLHKNGCILRETRLPPVEKWLGLAAFEGLCRQFFTPQLTMLGEH